MFLAGMINTRRITEHLLIIVLNNALEPDFLAMAHRRTWAVIKLDHQPSGPFVAYEVTGKEACDEVEIRGDSPNPWFAFDDADKWDGAKRWK